VEDVPPHPDDAELRPFAELRIIRVRHLAGRLIVGPQGAHRPGARLAREADAELGIDDPPGEHQVDRGAEVVGVFEEERPLFREIHLEAAVDGDLGAVRFHLAEVGIDGHVEHEAVLEDHLGVHAAVEFGQVAHPVRAVDAVRFDAPPGPEDAVGDELQVPARRDAPQAGGPRLLVQPAREPAGDARPERVFGGARDRPVQDDAPLLFGRAGKPERPERDLEPDGITLGSQTPLGVPERVKG